MHRARYGRAEAVAVVYRWSLRKDVGTQAMVLIDESAAVSACSSSDGGGGSGGGGGGGGGASGDTDRRPELVEAEEAAVLRPAPRRWRPLSGGAGPFRAPRLPSELLVASPEEVSMSRRLALRLQLDELPAKYNVKSKLEQCQNI